MAYFALNKYHILPHDLFNLPSNEQAFVYAAIELRAKAEKRAADKIGKK